MLGKAAVPPWSDQGLCLDCWSSADGCHQFLWMSARHWLPLSGVHLGEIRESVRVSWLLPVSLCRQFQGTHGAGWLGVGQVVTRELSGWTWPCSWSSRSGKRRARQNYMWHGKGNIFISGVLHNQLLAKWEECEVKVGIHLQFDGGCVKIPQLLRTS